MDNLDFPQVTAADIREIEKRAHELRAQAMADGLRFIGRAVAALPGKIAGLFARPRHA